VALFEAVTEAVIAVETVRYTFTVDGMYVMADTVRYHVEGQAVLEKGSEGLVDAPILVDYTMTSYPGEESYRGTVASDGVTAVHLNWTDSSYVYGLAEDGGAAIVLRDNVPQGSVIREFLFLDEPFGAELNAADYQYHEQEEIAGVLCNTVTVDMPPYTSRWWINPETMLPVANRISVWNLDGRGMEYMVTVMELETNVQTDSVMFRLGCPAGIEPVQIIGSLPQGSPAPLWTLETPEGESISLEGLRGKVVVMDFWATWCGPCRVVMPLLQELHETWGDELVIVGVNVWEQEDPAAFMAENGYTYQMVINGDDVASMYLVEGIPTFYVIAPDGTIAFQAVGADPANEAALREIVGTLLEQ
jgi:thiol-disulfide isomerase/thioredoxin